MTFKVLLHHYGRFTTPPGRRFVDGMVATIDPVELESFSTNQMKLILTNCLGYDENSATFLYIKKPSCSLDSGLIPLDDAIQDNELILTYTQTQHNRLHVYVSRVELSPLVAADLSKYEAMDFEDMVSYLTRKIPKRFTTLYYMLPSNHTLSGLKAIKNDYDTNVMYDIAKVAGKLQIYAAHHPIDLSTVLIPNDGSLEKSFAELAQIMNHVITDYTSDSEEERKEVTQNDYTYDQMIEWAEQEHFENEETKEVHCHTEIWKNLRQTLLKRLQTELQAEVTLANKLSCELTRVAELMHIREIHMSMLHAMPLTSLNSYGLHALLMTHELTVLVKLQEAIDEEACLEEQIFGLMHRFAERFTNRRVEINRLRTLHDDPLIDYGIYALGCMTGADMSKTVHLKNVRDELLRSMEEKRQLIKNYQEM
ncbi:hypothetical protein Tco_1181954 [Tanacetum coccineum]